MPSGIKSRLKKLSFVLGDKEDEYFFMVSRFNISEKNPYGVLIIAAIQNGQTTRAIEPTSDEGIRIINESGIKDLEVTGITCVTVKKDKYNV